MRRHFPDGMPLRFAKWIGTAAGVAGALVVALNLGVTAYGFMLFLISSVLWGGAGWVQRDASLVVLQGTFTAINIVGIYRWLGA
jgi:nicotinamide riboside transporter PnuC